MKKLITDLSNKLHSEALPETSHKFCCDDELMQASVKKEDLGTQVETHSFKLEEAISKSNALDGDVAELHADVGGLPQQLKMDAMRVDERKMLAGQSWRPQETSLFQ